MIDQAASRKKLYQLLGDLPERDRAISAKVLCIEEKPLYFLERIAFDFNSFELVPAVFIRPKSMASARPCVLYNHAHGGEYHIGKDEFLHGRSVLQSPPYAEVLSSLGFCGLCFDAWGFGERAKRTEMDLFKEMLWKGQALWGMMVYDSLRAVDYLAARPEIDAARLATMGLSMGSTMAWWVAALDERIKVCIDICCLTDFQALLESGNLQGHSIYYYVPGLLKQFTTAQINALIAPRPHLSLAGNLDTLTPPQGLDRIDCELQKVYSRMGHPENWRLVRYDVGHEETPEMRQEITRFLRKKL